MLTNTKYSIPSREPSGSRLTRGQEVTRGPLHLVGPLYEVARVEPRGVHPAEVDERHLVVHLRHVDGGVTRGHDAAVAVTHLISAASACLARRERLELAVDLDGLVQRVLSHLPVRRPLAAADRHEVPRAHVHHVVARQLQPAM